MRRAITIGFRHGKPTPEILLGPEVPIGDQRAAMRETRARLNHEEFETIELCLIDRLSRKRLRPASSAKEKQNPAKAAKSKT